jgi:long-chain acyl-CoA synthetase
VATLPVDEFPSTPPPVAGSGVPIPQEGEGDSASRLTSDLERIESEYARSAFVREVCLVQGPARDGRTVPRHLIVVPDGQALRARRTVGIRDLLRFELETCGVVLAPADRITGFDVSLEPLPRIGGLVDRAGSEERWLARKANRAVSGPRGTRPASHDEFGHDAPARAAIDALKSRRPQATLSPDTHLDLDLRLDSIERVDVLLEAERLAQVALSPDATWEIATIGDLAEALRTARRRGPGPAPDDQDAWATLLAATPPSTAQLRSVSRPKPIRVTLAFALLRVARWMAGLAIDIRISGTEHLPARGPFLLAPNHQTYFDGFLVCAALPLPLLRSTFVVGAPEYVATRSLARVAAAFDLVPVDPDSNLVSAMQVAAEGLRKRRVLLIFPEGERCLDGSLAPFRKGAAILASRLEVPVVPVAIDGAFEVWPRGRALQRQVLFRRPRHVLTVRFGTPIAPGRNGVPSEEGALAAHIRDVVAGMRHGPGGPRRHFSQASSGLPKCP